MEVNVLLLLFVVFIRAASEDPSESGLFDGTDEKIQGQDLPTTSTPEEDLGDMLFLSPFIKNGSLELARNLSKVEPKELFLNLSSYSGFITVDDQYNSNLWFWYFPATDGNPDAPLIVWLQGGPGISSLWGLLMVIGPFSFDGNNLKDNPYTWNKRHSLLFIDNPVGTGFSFTNSSEGYSTNITTVGEQLYSFMLQFLKVYPELQQVPLYICGESYGGKFVPALAYLIHINNSTREEVKINLQGIAIGNGFIDPVSMLSKSDMLYQLGFFDDDLRDQFAKIEDKCLEHALNEDFEKANNCYNFLSEFIIDKTGLSQLNLYNFAEEYKMSENYEDSKDFELQRQLANRAAIRKALHVGKANFTHPNIYVYSMMWNDTFGSTMKPQLEQLLEHYRVLLYNGQMDLMCPYPMAAKMYRKLQWSGSEEYLNATRSPWVVDEVVVWYFKIAGNLMEVLVRNAGHSVPQTQPKRSLLLIEAFIPIPALEDSTEIDFSEFVFFNETYSENQAQDLPTTSTPEEDLGNMLLLSPFIKNGSFELAKNLSKVEPVDLFLNISSHSGFITVNEQYNSSLWFWYFPAAEVKSDEAPLIVWLSGGPGMSSLDGLFRVLGPFSVDANGSELIANPHSWHKRHNLLFIDNPTGDGFSFSNDFGGYATNLSTVGEHLYKFMTQFLQVYPELKAVPLFICGESYAGKYVPFFASEIHKNNPTADEKTKINLQGIAIGDGFIHPEGMIFYSEFLLQLGFIDEDDRDQLKIFENRCVEPMKNGTYDEAIACLGDILNLISNSFLDRYLLYGFNRESDDDLEHPAYAKFVVRPSIRRALHVGSAKFCDFCEDVKVHLRNAWTLSAKPQLEEILNHYRVLLYNGQTDVICNYPMSVAVYRQLNWKHSDDYLKAERKVWIVDEIAAGYIKKAGNMMEVLVRNAGHSVPIDQPARSLLLIESFIRDTPLNEK